MPGRHSSGSRRRHTSRRARISHTRAAAAAALSAGTAGLWVSACSSALAPVNARSVPVVPIRATSAFLIHCWLSRTARARVACRVSRGTGSTRPA